MAITFSWLTRPWSSKTPPRMGDTTRDLAVVEDEITDNLSVANIPSSALASGILDVNFYVDEYGADPTGASDSSSAVQDAIDAAEAAVGGNVVFGAGTYLIGAALTINKAIRLIGAGTGGDTTDIFDESGLTQIVTTTGIGTSDTLITFASSTSGNVLEGCGIEGILFRTPTQRVQYAVTLKGVVKGRFQDLRFDQFGGATTLGVFRLIAGDGTTESCQYNVFDSIAIQMTGANAVGFILDGESNGGSCYQNVFRRIFVQHGFDGSGGHGVWLQGDVDNNHFYDCQFTRSGSAGDYGVYATAGASSHPRHNAFYGLNGHVYEEKEILGNSYYFLTSENSSYTQEGGPAHPAHYTVVDNTTRQMFVTQPYLMSDELFVPAGAFIGTSATAPAAFAFGLYGGSWELIDGVTRAVGARIPVPRTWGNGTITSIDIHYGVESNTNAGTVWVARIKAGAFALNASIGTPDYTTTSNADDVTIDAGTVENREWVYTLTPSIDFTEGDVVYLEVARLGGDANDTCDDAGGADSILFLGATLHFEADGPNTAGDFDIPARST